MNSKTAAARARTAMRRQDLSVPTQFLLSMGVLTKKTSHLDFGCGRGDDVDKLASMGFKSRGWDPVHRPTTRRTRSDVVTCNYVINVIEDPSERVKVIRDSWELAREMLLISARLDHEQDEAHAVPKGDGWITSRRTFQKFYSHNELRDLVASSTSTPVDAVAPGVFAVFRNESSRQAWKARRLRSSKSWKPTTKSIQDFQQHRQILEPLIEFVLERGRLPQGNELAAYQDILQAFGSTKKAFRVILNSTDREAWQRSATIRSVDLLVFLALGQFDGLDRMGKLPEDIQNDLRAHYGSFKEAHRKASELLFSAGNLRAVDIACRASTVGKLTPTALYIHRSAIVELPALLKVVLGCGQRLVGDIQEANVLKIFRNGPQISYLQYPNFDHDAHPWLARGWILNLQNQTLKTSKFEDRSNRPILHRIHEFMLHTDPRFQQILQLTQREESKGLYANPALIGTEVGWQNEIAKSNF